MRARATLKAIGMLAALTAIVAPAASAAPTWQVPQTVSTVRGIPDPRVAIDGAGAATIVYSDAPPGSSARTPGIYAVSRFPRASFGDPRRLGNGIAPQISVLKDGTTAIAWIDGDEIHVLLQPAHAATPTHGSVDVGGAGAGALRLALDGTGRATLVWTPNAAGETTAVQLRAVAISSDGDVGPIQELGGPAECGEPRLAVNLAGDAVAMCVPGDRAYVREASDDAFVAAFEVPSAVTGGYVGIDGAGTATVANPGGASGSSWVTYSDRPRGGDFGPLQRFDSGSGVMPPRLYFQEARTVVAWVENGRLDHAIRPAGGDFGPLRAARTAGKAMAEGFLDVTAALGPLPLLTSNAGLSEDPSPLRLRGLLLGAADDVMSSAGRSTVPGRVDFPGNVAGSESGVAVATWEQRCGEGFAVMAMVLDERRGTDAPPCQDRVAPRVRLVPRRRGRLVGRTVRARVMCDEACTVSASGRVVRRAIRRPLATGRTKGGHRVSAFRGTWVSVRVSVAQARRVRRALARGRSLTLRLSVAVRDDYENGRRQSLRAPLRG